MISYLSNDRMACYFRSNPDFSEIRREDSLTCSLGEVFLPLQITLNDYDMNIVRIEIDGIFFEKIVDELKVFRKIIKANTKDMFIDRNLLSDLVYNFLVVPAVVIQYEANFDNEDTFDLSTPFLDDAGVDFKIYLEKLYNELVE